MLKGYKILKKLRSDIFLVEIETDDGGHTMLLRADDVQRRVDGTQKQLDDIKQRLEPDLKSYQGLFKAMMSSKKKVEKVTSAEVRGMNLSSRADNYRLVSKVAPHEVDEPVVAKKPKKRKKGRK